MGEFGCYTGCEFAYSASWGQKDPRPKPGDAKVACWWKGVGKEHAVGAPCERHPALMREAIRRQRMHEEEEVE